ncbi:MAG: NnrU family protein [Lautropia sp.]|nr:NnrU family protein [Lautropia sp.]
MLVLIVGLIVFLGVHSTRIVAQEWRSTRIAGLGEIRWKGLYSVAALIGFGLIIWGYSLARQDPTVLWNAPVWSRHLAALLVLVAFVLLAAAYVPRNHIKSALGHPMFIGVKVWALGHLLSNGTLADLLLFGSFLIWAALGFRSARARDRKAQVNYPAGSAGATVATLVAGVAGWAIFAYLLHGPLIGVALLG